MATASARLLLLLFLVVGLSRSEARTTASSAVAGSNLLRIRPRFDIFVLYGQIHCQKLKELRRDKVRLSVELGDHVRLQDIENKYYTFYLPAKNSSGLVGVLSVLASDECGTTLWSRSFTVQDDVGAYRLDIDIVEIGVTAFCQDGGSEEEEGAAKGTFESESNHNQDSHSTIREYQANQLASATLLSGGLIMLHQEGAAMADVAYVEQLISCASFLQKWHLCFASIVFVMIRLLEALFHKSILLLDASGYPVGEVSSYSDTDLAVRHVCSTKPAYSSRPCFDSSSGGSDGSNCSFEDAWHTAEQYLNEAIDNDCQGAYFSYNCTSPQQERHGPALGRWNRDNAGRLIRNLWPYETES